MDKIPEDFQCYLDRLEEKNLLKRIDKPVNPRYEVAAYLRKTSQINGPALYFSNVNGSQIPVAGGLFATRRLLLESLGATYENRLSVYNNAVSNPLNINYLSTGPCQDVVREKDSVNLLHLPVITHFEKDGGPFITMGVSIARDYETGKLNVSIHRMQIHSKNEIGICLGPYSHLQKQINIAWKMGRPLEIAVAIGVSPAVILASQARADYGISELEIAGGFLGKPLNVVKCKTIDVPVPAYSELVLEGLIEPNQLKTEGPFGEYPGYYSPIEENPVVKVQAVTRRENPVYLAGLCGKPVTDNHVLRAITMESELLRQAKMASQNVRDVYMLDGGATFVAAISMKPEKPFESRQVLMSALGSKARCKYVIVVDEDIDISNTDEVLWAVSTRTQPAIDNILVPRLPLCELDPSTTPPIGQSAIGIDATRPIGEEFAEVAFTPGVELIDF